MWTRYENATFVGRVDLFVEISIDAEFENVVTMRRVRLSTDSGGTCRVLVTGLRPSSVFWYRFTDRNGDGSRMGRTRTAPGDEEDVPARFAFVSCQNSNLGPLTPWRRMTFEDRNAPPDELLGFVLHLGDFVYDALWQPEDRPKYFDRNVRALVRYPDGERRDDYSVPTTIEDYRALYCAYLADPDLQDAQAWFPMVAIWDNGEFSNDGWQGLQRFGDVTTPAQTRKVAANQAWFEYVPSRAQPANGASDQFVAPRVRNEPVNHFDASGLGVEPNNLAAIRSLIGYRSHRWGRHVEMWLTDQRSFRSEDYTAPWQAKALGSKRFPQMVPFESLQAIDAGRLANAGDPPPTLAFGDGEAPNWRAANGPRTLLGQEQKNWPLTKLEKSDATWKIWANTLATFDMRADPQNLPDGLTVKWPGKGCAGFARTDHSTAYAERAEICDFVDSKSITGFVTLSGDRHSFWAGYLAKQLPPDHFSPVGIAFVTGSISSPGMVESLEHTFPKAHALRALYLADRPGPLVPEPTVNLLLRDGVKSALAYSAHRDLERAKALANPDNAPHVSFVGMAGHGYSIVTAGPDTIETEFVCSTRPIAASSEPDGGPLRYRVTHSARRWHPGEFPHLVRTALHGDAGLSA